jgi:hyperpolarization activated cyclic nucleotide-gated potassium channel 4
MLQFDIALCRWGTTPLDEGRKYGRRPLLMLLEEAKTDELSKFPSRGEAVKGKFRS